MSLPCDGDCCAGLNDCGDVLLGYLLAPVEDEPPRRPLP